MHHRLEHLRRGDHRLAPIERAQDDPLLQQRDGGGADLDAEVAARDHHAVGLLQDVVQHVDRLGLLDLGDHAGRRACVVDQLPQVPDVCCGADERQGDEVDVEPERGFEIGGVLARQRGDRKRDAGQIHALVRRDGSADEHRAVHAPVVDPLHLQPDEPVVDEHLVAGPEDVADDRRGHGKRPVAGMLGPDERDVPPALEHDRLGELADP